MATIIHPNGSLQYIEPKGDNGRLTYDQLSQAVGGYVEFVYSPFSGNPIMAVNENGIRLELPPNPQAREWLAVCLCCPFDALVMLRGPCLAIEPEEAEAMSSADR